MKKIISLIICLVLLSGIAVFPAATALNYTPSSSYDSDIPNDGELPDTPEFKYSQTHLSTADNSSYIANYLDGMGTPLDGVNSVQDLCIPGLSKADNMVPQGMTYWPAKNRVLISAYDNKKTDNSVVYALDFDSGKYVAEYRINIVNHLGGIAVSEDHLYLATGKSISYISLSTLEEKEKTLGSAFDVDIEGKKSMATAAFLGSNAAVSYLSYSDGILWVGNFFYTQKPEDYNPYSDDVNSRIIGLDVTSFSAWKKSSSPLYAINVDKNDDDEINSIQGATYADGALYLSCSYGTRADSYLCVGKVTLIPNDCITISSSDVLKYKMPPMSEGVFVKDDFLYIIFESACYRYTSRNSKDPTDVVWRASVKDLDPLLSISINTMPKALLYNIGDSFNPRGFTLAAAYTDGNTQIVSKGITFTGFTSDTLGKKTVTATLDGQSVTFDVTVIKEKIPGRIYSVTAENLNVKLDQSKNIKIHIDAGEGQFIGEYSSSDPDVVSVNESGSSCTVTGLKRGSATITVKFTDEYGNEIQDTCTVRVRLTLLRFIIAIVRFIIHGK